jgi:hypothetical protein
MNGCVEIDKCINEHPCVCISERRRKSFSEIPKIVLKPFVPCQKQYPGP